MKGLVLISSGEVDLTRILHHLSLPGPVYTKEAATDTSFLVPAGNLDLCSYVFQEQEIYGTLLEKVDIELLRDFVEKRMNFNDLEIVENELGRQQYYWSPGKNIYGICKFMLITKYVIVSIYHSSILNQEYYDTKNLMHYLCIQ